jgi:hypothetical protein
MSTQPRERLSSPRYIRHNDQWYVSKEHMAEQLQIAILSAFRDGQEHAGRPLGPCALPALEVAL